MSDTQRQHIRELHQSDRYRDCNDQHFAELLAQHEDIFISSSTVRRIRREARIQPKRRRRPPKAHRPRERQPQFGMLVQLDGSFHPWLEDRAEPFALLAAIDDATGKIVAAVFRRQEDTEGYFRLTRNMVMEYGIPMSVYSDRHHIFRSPKETQTVEQELAGEPMPLSQFGYALRDLGITHIKAMTPQAKGRIERLFQTLQDRWPVELRLRGVCTLEEANRVLPELIEEFNRRFAVAPRETDSAFVPLEQGPSLDEILCYRATRSVGHGETLSYQNKTWRIDRSDSRQMIPPHTRVEVRQTLDGRVFVWYRGKAWPLQEIPKPDPKATPPTKKASPENRRPHKPAQDHPWRQYRRPFASKRVSQRA